MIGILPAMPTSATLWIQVHLQQFLEVEARVAGVSALGSVMWHCVPCSNQQVADPRLLWKGGAWCRSLLRVLNSRMLRMRCWRRVLLRGMYGRLKC